VTGTSQRDISTTAADAKQLVIYTPAPASQPNQEFLALDTPTATPEPNAAPILGGMPLCGLAFSARRARATTR
jgi:hypothetical protein